jgi:hypothetical protein
MVCYYLAAVFCSYLFCFRFRLREAFSFANDLALEIVRLEFQLLAFKTSRRILLEGFYL